MFFCFLAGLPEAPSPAACPLGAGEAVGVARSDPIPGAGVREALEVRDCGGALDGVASPMADGVPEMARSRDGVAAMGKEAAGAD